MLDQVGYFSREINIIKIKQMEILEMKSTITETKNVFNKFINELGITKERKLEDRPIQII